MCDLHDPLDDLVRLKESVPALKVTAFLIPKRSSKKLINRYLRHSKWLCLGMNGWRHTFGECYSWNPEEAEDKITQGASMGLGEAFRAPNWVTSPIIYDVCAKHNIVISDCKRWNCSTQSLVYRFDEPRVLLRPIVLSAKDPIDENAIKAIKTPRAKFSCIGEIAWKV